MVKTQEEILALILERTEDNPDKDVDEVVKEVYQELGLSQNDFDDYKQSAELIDKYTENQKEIQKAKKEEGLTLKEWFIRKWKKVTSVLSPEKKKEMGDAMVQTFGTELINNVEGEETSASTKEKQVEESKGKEAVNGIG